MKENKVLRAKLQDPRMLSTKKYLQDTISTYIQEYNGSPLDMSRILGISSILVESWKDKRRTIRPHYYKLFKKNLGLENPKLEKEIINYDNYLTDIFNECYKTHKKLIHYSIEKKVISFPLYGEDREDIFQKALIRIWTRLDEFDGNYSDFVSYIALTSEAAVSAVIKYHQRQLRIDTYHVHDEETGEDTAVRCTPYSLDYIMKNKEDGSTHTLLDVLHLQEDLEDEIIAEVTIEEALKVLEPRLRNIIVEYYIKGRTLAEVGDLQEVSRERIRQLRDKAFNQLFREITKNPRKICDNNLR